MKMMTSYRRTRLLSLPYNKYLLDRLFCAAIFGIQNIKNLFTPGAALADAKVKPLFRGLLQPRAERPSTECGDATLRRMYMPRTKNRRI